MNSPASLPIDSHNPAPESPPSTRRLVRRNSRRRMAISETASGDTIRLGHAVVDGLNVGFDPANLRRCSGCGGMVYLWPCLVCGRRKAA